MQTLAVTDSPAPCLPDGYVHCVLSRADGTPVSACTRGMDGTQGTCYRYQCLHSSPLKREKTRVKWGDCARRAAGQFLCGSSCEDQQSKAQRSCGMCSGPTALEDSPSKFLPAKSLEVPKSSKDVLFLFPPPFYVLFVPWFLLIQAIPSGTPSQDRSQSTGHSYLSTKADNIESIKYPFRE